MTLLFTCSYSLWYNCWSCWVRWKSPSKKILALLCHWYSLCFVSFLINCPSNFKLFFFVKWSSLLIIDGSSEMAILFGKGTKGILKGLKFRNVAYLEGTQNVISRLFLMWNWLCWELLVVFRRFVLMYYSFSVHEITSTERDKHKYLVFSSNPNVFFWWQDVHLFE